MTFYVVDVGEEHFLDRILGVNYTLRLFTNDVTAGLTDAQIEALTSAAFTEATFAGYSSKTLTGGSWTTSQDDPSVGVYAAQTFTRTSTGTAQAIRGFYLELTSSGALVAFEQFDGPVTVTANGDAVVATPRLTLGDQEDSMTARGIVAQNIQTDNDGPYTADSVTDLTLPDVPVVAGRSYAIHVHFQYTLSYVSGATDLGFNVLVRLNGSTLDRVEAVRNQSDTIGTAATKTDTVDGTVYWEPSVTASTDDLDVYIDEITGDGSIQLDGAGSARRSITLIDMGVV